MKKLFEKVIPTRKKEVGMSEEELKAMGFAGIEYEPFKYEPIKFETITFDTIEWN